MFVKGYMRICDCLVPVFYEFNSISGELVIHFPENVDSSNWYHAVTLRSDYDNVLSRLRGVSNDN